MANEKSTGNTVIFNWDSNPIACKSITFSKDATVEDTTTTATAATGMESTPIRIKCGITINAIAYDGSSNEITGNTLAITFGGTAFPVQTLTYDKQYTVEDVTTTAVTAPWMESLGIRFKATTVLTAFMRRDVADRITTTPTNVATVITLATGVTITGNALATTETLESDVVGMTKVNLTLEWQGVPTEVGLGAITLNTAEDFEVINETGTSTNKEVTGSAKFFGLSVTAGYNEVTKIVYTGEAQGVITHALYANT